DTENTLVTLQSTESGDLKIIKYPQLDTITREFDQARVTYPGANVTVVQPWTVVTFPREYQEYQVYTTPTIPSFTVKVPDRSGNVLLVKVPENVNPEASFTEIFKAAEKEGYYLFARNNGIIYYNSTHNIGSGINPGDYSEDDLNFTLVNNEVDLTPFSFNANLILNPTTFPKPKAGEYLLTAVEYDSAQTTMHVLAAMPVLILEKDTHVTWSDQSNGATVSFENGVDTIAYALVKNDTTYNLSMKVNTSELEKQPIPTSAADLVSILKSIAVGEGPVTYTLTPVGVTPGSGLFIAEGYGCSGANAASSVDIAAGTLATLNPGTYYLYALGMQGQNVTAIDQTEVTIIAPPTGSIEVTSVPTNATIYLDGAETGKFTNTTLTDVDAGDHIVTLKLDGYEDATQSVTVVAG
ncbi:MAG TPA: PEGA domain-containing protein, partial [Bacillota bacterium]|nr:PEGA domain-containing protein [Bacillota bacterium]